MGIPSSQPIIKDQEDVIDMYDSYYDSFFVWLIF